MRDAVNSFLSIFVLSNSNLLVFNSLRGEIRTDVRSGDRSMVRSAYKTYGICLGVSRSRFAASQSKLAPSSGMDTSMDISSQKDNKKGIKIKILTL